NGLGPIDGELTQKAQSHRQETGEVSVLVHDVHAGSGHRAVALKLEEKLDLRVGSLLNVHRGDVGSGRRNEDLSRGELEARIGTSGGGKKSQRLKAKSERGH